MKRKSRRKDGYFEGYTEYRYGTKCPAAAVRMPQIFAGQQREHILRQVTQQLAGWTHSPFQFEGSARHGLRSALCLVGFSWSRSDAEAEALVAEGLRSLRARRPTWEEGQFSYVEARENCRRCGVPLDDDANRGKRRQTYCSEVCARADIAAMEPGSVPRATSSFSVHTGSYFAPSQSWRCAPNAERSFTSLGASKSIAAIVAERKRCAEHPWPPPALKSSVPIVVPPLSRTTSARSIVPNSATRSSVGAGLGAGRQRSSAGQYSTTTSRRRPSPPDAGGPVHQ